MIATHRLGKSFGRLEALREIDLEAAPGECVGVSGMADSGRSTLLRVMGTLLAPTTGTIIVAGIDAVADVYQARQHMVHVGRDLPGRSRLSARDHVHAVLGARLPRTPAVRRRATDDALDRAQLVPDARVDMLTDERRARLAIATAFLLQPRVLLLDEPLQGLDAQWHGQCVEWLREVRDAGTTVVLAMGDEAHLVPLCHRVAHLAAGRLVIGDGTAGTAHLAGRPT